MKTTTNIKTNQMTQSKSSKSIQIQREICNNIIAQVGQKELYSMQAKNYSLTGIGDGIKGGVSFKIKKNNGINSVAIYLTDMDVYVVKFYNLVVSSKRIACDLVSEHTDIYCDMLSGLLVSETKTDVIRL